MMTNNAESVAVSKADLLTLLQLQERPRAVATETEQRAIVRLRAALGFSLGEDGWQHNDGDAT